MNKISYCIATHQTQQPQNDQHHSNCPQHMILLFPLHPLSLFGYFPSSSNFFCSFRFSKPFSEAFGSFCFSIRSFAGFCTPDFSIAFSGDLTSRDFSITFSMGLTSSGFSAAPSFCGLIVSLGFTGATRSGRAAGFPAEQVWPDSLSLVLRVDRISPAFPVLRAPRALAVHQAVSAEQVWPDSLSLWSCGLITDFSC